MSEPGMQEFKRADTPEDMDRARLKQRIERLTEERNTLEIYANDFKDRARRLLDVWQDPAALHANLLRSPLCAEMRDKFLHLAGANDYDQLKEESAKLRHAKEFLEKENAKLRHAATYFLSVVRVDPCDPKRTPGYLTIANRTADEMRAAERALRAALAQPEGAK